MPGNPYDGTLPKALEYASMLSVTAIHTVIVDRGYVTSIHRHKNTALRSVPGID